MDNRPAACLASENWKKEDSWDSEGADLEPEDTVETKGLAHTVSPHLVREYLAQYGSGEENPISPPPGYEYLPRPTVLSLSSSATVSPISIDCLPALCRSQKHGRKAQAIIRQAAPEVLERILQMLTHHLPALMVDAYGNYSCQTLFLSCSSVHRLLLITSLQPSLVEIAKDSHGTHSLQALIALISLQEEEEVIVQTIAPVALEFAMHPNASHVLQKLIATARHNSPLIYPLLTHLEQLCSNSLGVLVVKVAISSANLEDAISLRSRLISLSGRLMQDPYGNYAIQHMLETWGWSQCRQIIHQVKGKISQLSRQKFASNIIEKLLEHSTIEDRSDMLKELAKSPKLRELLSNTFSQYVVKKAVSLGGEEFKNELKAAAAAFPPTSQHSKRPKWSEFLSKLQ